MIASSRQGISIHRLREPRPLAEVQRDVDATVAREAWYHARAPPLMPRCALARWSKQRGGREALEGDGDARRRSWARRPATAGAGRDAALRPRHRSHKPSYQRSRWNEGCAAIVAVYSVKPGAVHTNTCNDQKRSDGRRRAPQRSHCFSAGLYAECLCMRRAKVAAQSGIFNKRTRLAQRYFLQSLNADQLGHSAAGIDAARSASGWSYRIVNRAGRRAHARTTRPPGVRRSAVTPVDLAGGDRLPDEKL